MKKKQRAKTSQAKKLTSAQDAAKPPAAKGKLSKKSTNAPPGVAKAAAASKSKKQEKTVAVAAPTAASDKRLKKTSQAAALKKTAAPKTVAASKTAAVSKASKTAAAPKKKGSDKNVGTAATMPVPSGETKSTAQQARDAAKEAAARQQLLFNEHGTGPAEGIGNRIPEFALNDQNGKTITLSQLAGKPFVLYFYPKDDTPGCTKEACDFRDELAAFTAAGVRVIGVSPDSHASHQKFAGKYGVNFTLLSDPEKALSNKLGVWQKKKNYGREYMGIVRSTFLVDEGGVIRRAWRSVKVAGHVPAVLKAIATAG